MDTLVEADGCEKLMYVFLRPEILRELARGDVRKPVQTKVHEGKIQKGRRGACEEERPGRNDEGIDGDV